MEHIRSIPAIVDRTTPLAQTIDQTLEKHLEAAFEDLWDAVETRNSLTPAFQPCPSARLAPDARRLMPAV